MQPPLVRLNNLFPKFEVFAKCEFLAPSGCFKIRGAMHLLERLAKQAKKPDLVVPSSGNTAVGAAVAANALGFRMTGVVPESIAKAKDDKLRALGVKLVKIPGGGTQLLQHAKDLAEKQGGYFVHPHLDPNWTNGYRAIADEILQSLPECRTIVFPLGGGGLLMGLSQHIRKHAPTVKLVGCEPHNYPKYAKFEHARMATIADGLLIETPHPVVQQRIADDRIDVALVPDAIIRIALKEVFKSQGLFIEPSSAITLAFLLTHASQLAEPIVTVLTGQNILFEDHAKLTAD